MNFDHINNYNKLLSFEEKYEHDLVDEILKIIPRSSGKKTVLDLAGGTGKFILKLKHVTGWDCTVSDISENMLKQALKDGLKIQLVDLNSLECNEKYDIIIIKYAIHFVKNLPKFYEIINCMLKDKGHFFIISRNKLIEYPVSERIKQNFALSTKMPEEFLFGSETFFDSVYFNLKYPIEVTKTFMKEFITQKAWSIIDEEDAQLAKRLEEGDELIYFYEKLILMHLAKK